MTLTHRRYITRQGEDSMAYYFSKSLPIGFDEAVRRTTDILQGEGFGIITKIDVKHLDWPFRKDGR